MLRGAGDVTDGSGNGHIVEEYRIARHVSSTPAEEDGRHLNS